MSGASARLGRRPRTRSGGQDALRRWDRARKAYHRDEGHRRVVTPEEVRRPTSPAARDRRAALRAQSVERDRSRRADGAVEIEADSYLITAAVIRDSVEELGLVEGIEATATVRQRR